VPPERLFWTHSTSRHYHSIDETDRVEAPSSDPNCWRCESTNSTCPDRITARACPSGLGNDALRAAREVNDQKLGTTTLPEALTP
jgi:hypothetical protein